MPCYHPIKGWKARSPSENGGRAVVFNARDGFADQPMTVPCGQCIGCRLERSRQWAIRCVHEAGEHKNNCFITLTYDDESLPRISNPGRGKTAATLVKSDFQNFFKRLRKNFSGVKIRFFHAGEYGETTGRPHYHALIFNLDFFDKVLFRDYNGSRVYTSETLSRLWGHGFCTVGDVTFESAAYVARYCLKKITGDESVVHYGDRLPEYTTMSRMPGIGDAWIRRYSDDTYKDDKIFLRGKLMRPPRFYDEKLKISDQEKYEYIKRARRVVANIIERGRSDEIVDQCLVDEKVKSAQIKPLMREF